MNDHQPNRRLEFANDVPEGLLVRQGRSQEEDPQGSSQLGIGNLHFPVHREMPDSSRLAEKPLILRRQQMDGKAPSRLEIFVSGRQREVGVLGPDISGQRLPR